jgi:hypothetical protein
MGFRSDGTYEPYYALGELMNGMTLFIYLSVVITTLVTAYFVAIARKIANKKFEMMMIVLLAISIFQQLLLLSFLFGDTPPIVDWINTTLGVYQLMGSGIVHCEILYFFSSLTDYWTLRKIRLFEAFWVLFHFVCYGEGYTQLFFLGRKIPASIDRGLMLYGNGITLYCVAISMTYTAKSLHIKNLLYRHFSVTQGQTIHKRMPQMRRLVYTIVVGSVFDWMGITCFALGVFLGNSRSFFTLGVTCLYLHVNSTAWIFHQLKYITITKQEDLDGTPKKTIQWLVSPKASKETAEAPESTPTVLFTRTVTMVASKGTTPLGKQ